MARRRQRRGGSAGDGGAAAAEPSKAAAPDAAKAGAAVPPVVPVTAFRLAERRFRAFKGRPVADVVRELQPIVVQDSGAKELERVSAADAQAAVYRLRGRDGIYVVAAALSVREQAELAVRAVTVYPRGNANNLDAHGPVPPDGVWVTSAAAAAADPAAAAAAETALYRLRWVTLGLHYDWTAKVYPPGRAGVFPADLSAVMARLAATAAACPGVPAATAARLRRFAAEAAIVNYYHPGDTLVAHTDHSEEDLEAPLLSLSLGLPAVFLIGGMTRDEPPSALLLQSGDVMIMEGPSRLSYHGVPLVFADGFPAELAAAAEALLPDAGAAQRFRGYLQQTRININVRQMWRRDHDPAT